MAKYFVDLVVDMRSDLKLVRRFLDACRAAEQPAVDPQKLLQWFATNGYDGVTLNECQRVLDLRKNMTLAGDPDAY